MLKTRPKNRTNNTLWRCAVCEEWHTGVVQSYIVQFAFQPKVGGGQMGIGETQVMVDKKCFDKLELEDEKPKLVVPTSKDMEKFK